MLRASLICILFPYVGFLGGYDIQPFYAIPLIITWLAIQRTTATSLTVFLLCLAPLLYFMIGQDTAMGRQMVYGLGLISAYLMYDLRHEFFRMLTKRLVVSILFAYLFVGIVQLFFGADMFSFLVARDSEQALIARESGRGVRSLTGEPQQFGDLLLAIYLLSQLALTKEKVEEKKTYRKNTKYLNSAKWNWEFITLLGIVLLAQSSYSTAIYFGILLVKITPSINMRILKWILLTCIVVYLGWQTGYLQRWSYIFNTLFQNPDLLLQQGAIVRLMNPVITIFGILECFPSGLAACEPVSVTIPLYVATMDYVISARVQGGILEPLLIMGLAGIPIAITFLLIFASLVKAKSFAGVFGCLLIAQSGAPFNPLIILVIVCAIAASNGREYKKNGPSAHAHHKTNKSLESQ